MKPSSRTVALVSGFLLLLPALALLLAGVGLGIAAAHQDEDGYVSSSLDGIGSAGAAVAAAGPTVLDADVPAWVREAFALDVRVVADSRGGAPIFLGFAEPSEVRAYLDQVAYTEVVDVEDDGPSLVGDLDGDPVLVEHAGRSAAAVPTGEAFWSASVDGTGSQTLDWDVTDGASAVVLMHADGSPGIDADVTVAVRTWPLLPWTVGTLLFGLVVAGAGVALCVIGARGSDRPGPSPGAGEEPVRVTDRAAGVS